MHTARFVSFAAMLTETFQIRHFTGHQFQSTEVTSLSLVISPDSMVYSVSLSDFKEVFELGHMEFSATSSSAMDEKLEFFVRNFLLHKRKFSKVLVSVLNTDFTLLPFSFGQEQDVKDYLQFAIGDTSGKHLFSHRLNEFRFCYALEADLRQVLEKNFNSVFIRHAGAVNLHLFFNHRSFANVSAALFLGDHFIQIALKRKESLVYYNVLRCTGNEDVLYFLLFALEQYGFDPASTILAVSAEIPADAELLKTLKKYIHQVQMVVTGSPIKLHKDLAQLPAHQYFTLLNQHACEL